MPKQFWRPAALLNPVPVVLVSCADKKGNPNILTVAWAGTVNSKPPMLSVSIRKERYSNSLIRETKEFVVNLPSEKMLYSVDFCGVKSGLEVNKFDVLGLTPQTSSTVKAPGIGECPVNIECVVKRVISLGSHDMFIAEVKGVQVDEQYIDKEGKVHFDQIGLLAYAHGEYYSLGERLGYYGFSVTRKKSTINKRMNGKKIAAIKPMAGIGKPSSSAGKTGQTKARDSVKTSKQGLGGRR